MGESRSTQGVHGGEIAQYTGKAVFSAYYVQKCHTRVPETAVSRSFVTVRDREAPVGNPGSAGFRTVPSAKPEPGVAGRGETPVLSLAPCRTGFVFAASSADEVRHEAGQRRAAWCRHPATVLPAVVRRPVRGGRRSR